MKAASFQSLKDVAQHFLRLAQNPGCGIDGILDEAARLQRQWTHPKSFRAALLYDSLSSLALELKKFIQGESSPVIHLNEKECSKEPQVVFLFTGQGCQYPEMGRGLFESQKSFRSTILECDEIFRECLKASVVELLYQSADRDLVHQTRFTQPSLFAIEYAISQMWISFGIHPHALIGHSVGELAAACVSGVFNLENGLKLIVERARQMDRLPAGGGMTVVMAPEEFTLRMIQNHSEISIAAVNGPQMTVIAGSQKSLDDIHKNLEKEKVSFTKLQVSHAFHSPLMDPALDPFEKFASQISMSPPKISLVSNLTGRFAEPKTYTSSYWRRHLREAVQFNKGVQNFADTENYLFLEVGPANVLNSMSKRILGPKSFKGYSTLQKGIADQTQLATVAAQLYVHGCSLNWSAFYDLPGRTEELIETESEYDEVFEQILQISDREIFSLLKRRSA